MKWTSALWVSAGVLVALSPACSGSVKGTNADDADDSNGAGYAGTVTGSGGVSPGTTSKGGSPNSAGAGHITPGQGGAAGAIFISEPGGAPPDYGWAGFPDPGGDSGSGGEGGVKNDACDNENGNGCIVEYGTNIAALTADDSAVYWVEHGTSDSLGNYKNDGRLLKRALGGQTSQVIAAGLAGPVGIGLTTTHYYLYLDQAWDADGQYALARIPLEGGSPEIIQRGAQLVNAYGQPCPHCFAHLGSTAIFPMANGIFSVDESTTTPVSVTNKLAQSLATSGQYLYFDAVDATTNTEQVWRAALPGGTPERISTQAGQAIRAVDANLYGIVEGQASYFSRMPVAGSTWSHLAKLNIGAVSQLDLAGTLYFYDLEVYDQPYRVYADLLAQPGGQTVVLTAPRKVNVKAWAGTASGLYWTDGHSVRLRTSLPE